MKLIKLLILYEEMMRYATIRFSKILGMSWSASIVILAVCLGRILLKKYQKYISYLLGA